MVGEARREGPTLRNHTCSCCSGLSTLREQNLCPGLRDTSGSARKLRSQFYGKPTFCPFRLHHPLNVSHLPLSATTLVIVTSPG